MNALFIYFFALFKKFISIFTNMYTRNDSKSDSESTNQIDNNEIKVKWKISNYLNKGQYYSTNSLKLIFCKSCNYNITTKHWHCFNDEIYCDTCYYKIPLVKKMMVR
jgi:hypothetical protein